MVMVSARACANASSSPRRPIAVGIEIAVRATKGPRAHRHDLEPERHARADEPGDEPVASPT
jgi:hypothetical protein